MRTLLQGSPQKCFSIPTPSSSLQHALPKPWEDQRPKGIRGVEEASVLGRMGAAGRKHWSELRGAPGRHQCAEDQAFGTVRTRHSGSNWAARTLVWDIQVRSAVSPIPQMNPLCHAHLTKGPLAHLTRFQLSLPPEWQKEPAPGGDSNPASAFASCMFWGM